MLRWEVVAERETVGKEMMRGVIERGDAKEGDVEREEVRPRYNMLSLIGWLVG